MNVPDGHVDIRKAGGVIIKDRKFLVTRSAGKDHFIAPGGKLESDENSIKALKRELVEELGIIIYTDTLEPLGTFRAIAAGKQGVTIEMDVFIINDYEGIPSPLSEVEGIRWIDSQTKGIPLGSIFEHEVMPLLVKRGLID